MKSYIPLLALAASVEATFKKNAPPFSCPANTNNKCTPKQNSGFDWSDLVTGPFTNYGDFNFKGFTCGGGGGGTGRSGAGGGGKFIGGTCHPEKGKSPSFGSKDNFSVGSIRVEPEFDCDLEFHYDMPNGSVCKHRNSCKKSGTTVVNKQCGGAKGVTIIYPPQPGKPKPSCSIKVPTVSFDCSTASSTKTPSSTKATSTKATSKATSTAVTTTSEVKTSTSAVKPESSTSAAPATSTTVPAESSATTAPAQSSTAPVESSTAPGQTSTAPSETSTAVVPGSSTKPAESSTAPSGTSTAPSETSTAPGGTSTAPGETSTAPGKTSTDVSPGSSTASAATSTPITTVITTEFESTSTVFSTVVSTITSCAPEVPNCPASGGVTTTVVTVAISTTICPVTETRTTVISSATAPAGGESTAPAGGASSVPAGGDSSAPASVGTTPAPIGGGASTTVAVGTTLTTVKPIETLPCPDVVPSCVNTFMFSVGCKDSTDIACYCPDALFVKNVYDCLYAHGESDQIISEAVIFFQGICAPWVGGNPAVVTAPTVTSYLTVTAAPTAAPVYTTITVDATTVVPCTDEAGQEIPSSSTTVVISTTMQVPQIGFTTGVQGSVDLIPITAAPIVDGGNGGGEGGNNNGGGAVITNGTTIQVPTGTGSIRPTSSVVLAGSGRVGTSFGLAAAVAALAAFAL